MQKTVTKTQQLEKHRQAMRKYYYDHPERYYQYAKDNPEKVKLWVERYRKSEKGKIAIKKYESKPHRLDARAFWAFKKRLKQKVKDGKITEYEMRKRIKVRLEKE